MSLFRTHIPEFSALIQKFFLPSHQFAGAICRDRRSASLNGLLSLQWTMVRSPSNLTHF
jgi:hypothetical protein